MNLKRSLLDTECWQLRWATGLLSTVAFSGYITWLLGIGRYALQFGVLLHAVSGVLFSMETVKGARIRPVQTFDAIAFLKIFLKELARLQTPIERQFPIPCHELGDCLRELDDKSLDVQAEVELVAT